MTPHADEGRDRSAPADIAPGTSNSLLHNLNPEQLAAVTLTNGEVRWRIAVINMKLKGQVPSFGWRELLWNLRPHSPIYLRYLPILPNPDLAIENPFTAPEDSVVSGHTDDVEAAYQDAQERGY